MPFATPRWRLLVPAAAVTASVLVAGPLGLAPDVTPRADATPVLGQSKVTPEEIAAWYRSKRIRSRSPTPVRELARLFVEEGNAQGVRGDLAFAQSMVETGWLRYGGQVRPSDHNFSGLGACDSCRRGLAFGDPTIGVRAQIQHLYAYAEPDASEDQLAQPLVDIRFDKVSPKGRARTWQKMGRGNWATDRAYGRKVLRVYREIRVFARNSRAAGLSTPPVPGTPVAPVAVSGTPLPPR